MERHEGESVRWGIFGVGDVCEVKHRPVFQRITEIIDRNTGNIGRS